jgi:hypothetical protein
MQSSSAYDDRMAVIHIPEAEAVRDFSAVMARVRAGYLVRIDSETDSFTLLPAQEASQPPRTAPDILAALEARGSTATLAEGFADAVEEGIRAHQNEVQFNPWA